MFRWTMLALAAAMILPATLAAEIKEGYWRLAQKLGVNESNVALLKVEKKDGKLTASVADAPGKSLAKIDSFQSDGNKVTAALTFGTNKFTFEGVADPKDEKVIRGAFFNDQRAFRGVLVSQEAEKLPVGAAAMASRPKTPEPYQAAMKLTSAPTSLRFQATRSQDANEKADLLAKAKAAQKEAEEKTPALYRETVTKHGDSPFAVEAATALLRMAGRAKATPQEVVAWLDVVNKDAVAYGPRIAHESTLQMAELLVGQKGYEAAALPAATRATEGLHEKSPLALQSRALKALHMAQAAAGKKDEAKATEVRLVKIEKSLDDEYIRTVPPFKPEKFAGRKNKEANRAVVMELFTGATCPPCVAADAAFDGLEKTYTPKELILIQYHMHIPGPDPMTNPDTIARWDYYREKFPEGIRGVPSSLFNGTPKAGGGGGMANSESKYKQYTEVINPLLEEKAEVKITGNVHKAGEKVVINVGVDGVKSSSDKVKLRILLVEEKVKYAGSNGMRFHHQVVRAMPGGAAGIAVTEGSQKKTVEANIAEIRKGLTKYLDDFSSERPFANPERPMDLAHLKVIALVQDDATGAILNAAQFDVGVSE